MKTLRNILSCGAVALGVMVLAAAVPKWHVAPSYPSPQQLQWKPMTAVKGENPAVTATQWDGKRRAAASGDTWFACLATPDVDMQGVYTMSLTEDAAPELLFDLSGYGTIRNALQAGDTYYVFLADKTLKVDPVTWTVLGEEGWTIDGAVTDLTYLSDTQSAYYVETNTYTIWQLSLTDGTTTKVREILDDLLWEDPNAITNDGQGNLMVIDSSGAVNMFTTADEGPYNSGYVSANVGNGSTAFRDNNTGDIYLSAYQNIRSGITGALWKVYASALSATKVYDRATPRKYMGVGFAADPYAPGVPEAVTGLTADFVNDILSGTVSFTLPATTHDGQAGTGALTWHLTVNGEEQQAQGEWGETVTHRNMRLDRAGMYTFEAWCTNNAGEGPRTSLTQFVGYDTPKAPANVKLTVNDELQQYVVSWDAPDALGVNGTELNPDSYYYIVTRQPGNVTVTPANSGTRQTTFAEDMSHVANAGNDGLWYEVVTVHGKQQSEPAKSNALNNSGLVPPITIDTANDDASRFIYGTIDVNGDGDTWKRGTDVGFKPYILTTRWSGSEVDRTPDDMLILAPVSLSGGLSYAVNLDMRCYATGNIENFTLYMAKDVSTADAVKQGIKLLDNAPVTSHLPSNPSKLQVTFVAPESGDYYPVLYCNTRVLPISMSSPNSNRLYMLLFNMGPGVNGQAPAALKQFIAEGAKDGSNNVVLTMMPPTTNQLGQPLSGLTELQIDRDGVFVTTIPANGHPTVWSEPVPGPGEYTYTVTTYNAAGTGTAVTATAIVGLAKPTSPATVTATYGSVPESVKLKWTPVTTDVNGKNLTDVTYSVHLVGYPEALATGLTDTEVELKVVADGAAPQFMHFMVMANNEHGGTGTVADEILPIGAHYTIPMYESFTAGSSAYAWLRAYMGSSQVVIAPWLHNGEPYDGSGQLGFTYGAMGESCLFTSAVIDIPEDAVLPILQFQFVNYGHNDNQEIEFMIDDLDGNGFRVADYVYTNLLPDKQWVQKEIDLSAYRGKSLRFQIRGTHYGMVLGGGNYTAAFDCFMLYDKVDSNLGLVSSSQPSMRVGEEATITARYRNIGSNAAEGYEVVLYANGREHARKAGEALPAGEWGETAFTFTPDASMTNATFSVEVVWAADMKPEDNASLPFTVAVTANAYPAVADLTGTMDTEEGVALQWTEPVIPTGTYDVDESFETYAFGATSFNDFTTFDGDGFPVGGINIPDTGEVLQIPGIQPFSTPLAWTVFDSAQTPELMPQAAASDGDKYAITLFNSTGYTCPGPNEDWLITPMLANEEQNISFDVRSLNANYPNWFMIMASKGSNRPEEFESIDNLIYEAPAEWTPIVLNIVPNDGQEPITYLAIVDVTFDGLALAVDNIHLTAQHLPLTVLGYNVYRDGVRVNEEPLTEPVFNDAATTEGEHTYSVSIVYNLGEGPLCAPLTLKPEQSSLSAIEAAADAEATYFNLQGQRISHPQSGTVVIRVRGSVADKVLIK